MRPYRTDLAGAAVELISVENPQTRLKLALNDLRTMGIRDVLVGNLGLIGPAREAGMRVHGDFGLNVMNSQTIGELRRMGLASCTLSFEMNLAQIRDMSLGMDSQIIAYGRLPLMITENCIISGRYGRCACENNNALTDRTGARFPVVKAPGCRNEILNSKKLFLADKAGDYSRLGLWGARLMFTTETAIECVSVLERYLGMGNFTPNEYTRGLYYRDVE